jgi:hypothetical protein
MVPVEKHVGGIVLGVARLDGKKATTFAVDNRGVDNPLPPDRADPVDETIGLGLNDLTADKFFLYKSWKYDDPGSSTGTRTYGSVSNADVYTWITAGQAVLDTEGGSNDNCGDQSNGFDGSDDCDLLVYSGEVSAGYFRADIDALGVNLVETLERYWIDDPERDTCGFLELEFGIPTDLNVCLQLIRDGAIGASSIGSVNEITLKNFMTRVHYAGAVSNRGKDKTLELTDAYLEIRHGKGFDRSRVLDGDTSESTSRGNQWQEPIDDPTGTGVTYRHGLSQDFECRGNPSNPGDGVGDVDCDPSQDPNYGNGAGDDGDREGGSESDGAYDDIHR